MKMQMGFLLGCVVGTLFGSEVDGVTISSDVVVQEVSRKTSFERFKNDLTLFYVDPSWVLVSFLEMSLDEFDKAWAEFIALIRYRPWFFFVSDQKSYSEKKYREQFLVYCRQYDAFLRDLVVDVHGKRILLTANKVNTYTQQPGIITIFQYWQAKKNTDYQHLYAFYFDRVAAKYVESISNLFFQIDSPEYGCLHQKTCDIYMILEEIFARLKGGEYDSRYAQHLQRYDQVLLVLEKERRALQEELL